MSKWYGSVANRIEENHMFCDEIAVGTGVTEYSWSDRTPYEVIDVTDQKHVTVRELDHVHVGDVAMDNNWKLIQNENNPSRRLVRRGKYWYWETTVTAADVADADSDLLIRLAISGYDVDRIRTEGSQTRRSRANVSFGIARYYYDYSF